MKHPFEFISPAVSKRVFIALLVWTLGLMALMQVLNRPLQTAAAPAGIVSYELAWTPAKAQEILASWEPQDNPPMGFKLIKPYYAAFSLGFDYLFMPSYATAIALGVLLAARRRSGLFLRIGAWLGWGALAAAGFDALENFALWRQLTDLPVSPWPQVAAVCATIKFTLILLGLAYALLGWLGPRRSA